MSPLARNKTQFTKEIFDEGYDRLFGNTYRKSVRKFIYPLIALLLIAGIAIIGLGLPVVYLFTEGFFLLVLLIYINVILPRNYKKNVYKKLCSGCSDSIPWRSYDFYEDHLTVRFPNGSSEEYAYEDIENIYSGQNVFVLFTKGKHNILIDKSTFIGELPNILKK